MSLDRKKIHKEVLAELDQEERAGMVRAALQREFAWAEEQGLIEPLATEAPVQAESSKFRQFMFKVMTFSGLIEKEVN